ncbi:ATPase, partial [Glaciimonas sp. CA11.2]|nr:ATPase [Glaciimonas sp. CA11.2]
ARNMLWRAGNEIAKMALALDVSEQLPLALCGGLAHVLKDYLPQTLQLRTVPPEADSSSGGLLLIRQHLEQ